jgi:hypothetical protein
MRPIVPYRWAVIISIELGANAEEYNARYGEVLAFRPARCPDCRATQINVHDWYPRWAVYLDRDIRIRIQRFRCAGCRKTIAMLPNFLHRCRHYALSVIGSVVIGRCVEGKPWSQLGPSRRTAGRWWQAFQAQAAVWLAATQVALAIASPGASDLDPHDRPNHPPVVLLRMGRILANWLIPSCADWLRVMWCWGWNAGIGRLI